MAETRTGHRVVVTGLGVVSAIGETVEAFWASLKAGRSGIGPIKPLSDEGLTTCIGAAATTFDHRQRLKAWVRDKTIMHAERYSWLAAAAATEAIEHAGLAMPLKAGRRSACLIGSAGGGQITAEVAARDRYILNKRAVHPMMLLRIIGSSAAAHVGIEFGIKGPVFATCSAGASASHAIGLGRDYIRHGLVDIALVGGSEAMLNYGTLIAAQSLEVLSPTGCRPFAADRDGMVLGEGAGILVLESEAHARGRGAKMLAEVCGYGATADGADIAKPDLGGASEAMRLALADAGLAPSAITYINAHGTGTVANDLNETRAIKDVFGAHTGKLAVSSTKSMHGHTLGAAGAIEAIACIKAIADGFLPPTIGLAKPDPECDLDFVPNAGRAAKVEHAMSNSFAFGGLNASFIIGPPPA
jgi:nodulation protein E